MRNFLQYFQKKPTVFPLQDLVTMPSTLMTPLSQKVGKVYPLTLNEQLSPQKNKKPQKTSWKKTFN